MAAAGWFFALRVHRAGGSGSLRRFEKRACGGSERENRAGFRVDAEAAAESGAAVSAIGHAGGEADRGGREIPPDFQCTGSAERQASAARDFLQRADF